MQPLNPFLGAFFKSQFVAQCTPIYHHILLVPTTEILLTSRDKETGAHYEDLVLTDEFIGSHVLRIPSAPGHGGGQKDVALTMREQRGKARQFGTINGRTVIIKDSYVYGNKGFKTLNQAQLLNDNLYYPDSLEPRAWLIYYITRPLIGTVEEIDSLSSSQPLPTPYDPLSISRQGPNASNSQDDGPSAAMPRKKVINTFNELLMSFPMITKQMQPGLEKLFKEFNHVFEKPLPPPPSADHIPDPHPEGPIAASIRLVRSSSAGSIPPMPSENGSLDRTLTGSSYAEDEETVLRGAMETAVTAAIDLFQAVDKQQLSLLGATTDLTGPIVEKLIERYVAEQLHDVVFAPKLVTMKRPEDLELESKIRQMEFIDISQVGIPIQGGQAGKQQLGLRIGKAVEEFKKLTATSSPMEMMDILLATLKTVTMAEDVQQTKGTDPEKVSPIITINADTLVSLLLVVVIRSKVKFLQARLLYMRHFIYVEDVESGEMGYALSTLEAVLSYLQRDSIGLRKASRRNKKLWEATTKGDVHEIRKIMEPDRCDSPEPLAEDEGLDWSHLNGHTNGHVNGNGHTNGHSKSSSKSGSRRQSQASTLAHVFPFQAPQIPEKGGLVQPVLPIDDPIILSIRRPKSVTLDMRSMSISSEVSYRSRATTIDSISSGIEGDTSIQRLAQTEDVSGESVLMMAVTGKTPESLRYLLELEEYYPLPVIMEDKDNEGTTLLSAAVQTGNKEVINMLLDRIKSSGVKQMAEYLAKQDNRGRSVGHYLFTAPWLIMRIGRLIPWRQKDKNGQTPLFALCRSYDNGNYRDMVEAGIIAAAAAQTDGAALHLEDHVDSKGNTLLHIVNDPQVALRLLLRCDADINATNDKKFTPLMVASKYGRLDIIRILFNDPKVDFLAKDGRGMTAVELAKDEDTRSRIDDLVLFSNPAADDGRITSVVRSLFVDDATIRLVVKSGAPSPDATTYTVTTCKRSLTDFENLAKCLAIENPVSWLPHISGSRTPFQLPSKPSRAVLRDIQVRLDGWLKVLLSHPTFSTHEMLWEFLLVPDIQADAMMERSKAKAEALKEKIREEFEPIGDVGDVEGFVGTAVEMVRSVNYATKSVVRRTNVVRVVIDDFSDASRILGKHLPRLSNILPPSHITALQAYIATLTPPTYHPITHFHTHLLTFHSTLTALLISLSRPPHTIASIRQLNRSIARNKLALSRSSRWPLGLLDDTRLNMDRKREEEIRLEEEKKVAEERELRFVKEVVVGEVAGWNEWRGREVRRGVRELARGCLEVERGRLQGMLRALRAVRGEPEGFVEEQVFESKVERERGRR